MSRFKNKIVAITGVTGSLGKELIKQLLAEGVKEIVGISRDELKQHELRESLGEGVPLTLKIADVRDTMAVFGALKGVDVVIHAAALKHVRTGEVQPEEVIKTNVTGSQNVVDACKAYGITSCVLVSTDKAVEPVNAYGASKLLAEKIFLANGFTVVRYGNVRGSRGSVLEKWANMQDVGIKEYELTHGMMSRFFIDIGEAAKFVLATALLPNVGKYGAIFIPDMSSIRMLDLLPDDGVVTITGKRPGEKIHEKIISKDESGYLSRTSHSRGYVISNDPQLKQKEALIDVSSDPES